MDEAIFKQKCGMLMGIYRQERYQATHQPCYTQRGMIMKQPADKPAFQHQKTLCSTTTLRAIEKGTQTAKEDLYQALARHLDKNYHYSRKEWQILNHAIQTTNQAVEQMNLGEMNQLYQLFRNHPQKKLIYNGDILSVLEHLLLFFLKDQPPTLKWIKHFQQSQALFPATIRQMILFLCCAYCRKTDYSLTAIANLLTPYSFSQEHYLSIYTLTPYYLSTHQLFRANQLLLHLTAHPDFPVNPYKQYYYYNTQACLQTSTAFDQASISLKHCLILMYDRRHFCPHHQAAIIYNLGILAQLTGQYEQAVNYFKQALQLHPDLAPPSLPLLYQTLQHLPQQQQIFQLALETCQQLPLNGLYQAYYHYFQLRLKAVPLHRQQARELENIILERIIPALRMPGQAASISNQLLHFFFTELQLLNPYSQSRRVISRL